MDRSSQKSLKERQRPSYPPRHRRWRERENSPGVSGFEYLGDILSIGFHMLLKTFGSTGAIVRGEWGSQVRWRCCMSPPLRHSVRRRSRCTILWKTWGILSNGWLVTIGTFPPSINIFWCNGENLSNKSQLWNQRPKLGAIVDSLRQVPNSFSPQRHQSNHTAPRLIVWKTSR
jgi:hypothetical protein